jgi:hypothetical protein
MRKFLVFPDGHEYELSPLTFDEFTALDRWVGGNDIAFREFLSHNKFHEIDDFDQKIINECKWDGKGWERVVKVELRPGEPTIDWTVTYGGMP